MQNALLRVIPKKNFKCPNLSNFDWLISLSLLLTYLTSTFPWEFESIIKVAVEFSWILSRSSLQCVLSNSLWDSNFTQKKAFMYSMKLRNLYKKHFFFFPGHSLSSAGRCKVSHSRSQLVFIYCKFVCLLNEVFLKNVERCDGVVHSTKLQLNEKLSYIE